MNKIYIILGVAAVIGVGAIAYTVGAGAGGAQTTPIEVPGLEDPETLVSMAQGVVMGEEDAPVTIIEFGDYQCPGCRQFATLTKPQIVLDFVDDGEAKFVFYDFPLTSIHGHAFLAARAARCAEAQDRFWDYHDELFANQAQWSASSGPPVGDFVRYAEDLGLDEGRFESCLRSDRFADVVTANMRLGEELGVGGTPTVMVSTGAGRTIRVPQPGFPNIAAAVNDLLGTAEEAEADSGAGG